MVKVKIIGQLGLTGKTVSGRIRFLSENDETLGEYDFAEPIDDIKDLSADEFTEHAVKKMRKRLKADKLSDDWAKTLRNLGSLIVEEEVVEE